MLGVGSSIRRIDPQAHHQIFIERIDPSHLGASPRHRLGLSLTMGFFGGFLIAYQNSSSQCSQGLLSYTSTVY